jgi:cytochrome c peroxidase
LGLASWGNPKPDVGRYAQKPVAKLKGAFKTPQLRGITLTAPYFHDGSAKTLEDVVNHYVGGGVDKSNLDPNIHPLALTEPEKQDLLAFLNALTGTTPAITIPVLPQ